jgi:hypothetical protein
MARQPIPQVAQAMNLIHQAIALEPEPEDKAALTQVLGILTKLQSKNMSEQGSGGSPGPVGAFVGGGGGSPPAGPAIPADPRAALMSLMGR